MEPARSTLYRTFLLCAIPALLIFGFGLGVPALPPVAAAWIAVLAAGWMSARLRLRGITVRRELYPSAFEEDEVAVDLILEADRRAAMVEVADAFGPSIADEHRLLEPGPLRRGTRRRLSYRGFCSRHWGVYTVGPVQILTVDSAGLFRAWKRIPEVDEFAVFPRVYDVSGLARLGSRAALSTHELTAGRPGRSPLYLGVRDYRPGDDLRHIHWPASARRGELVVKEYEVDLAPYLTVFLDLDARFRAGTGKKSTLEYTVRSAASIVWSATRAGNFVQVIGAGRRPIHVPPGRGETHMTFALYELLRAAQDGRTPLDRVVTDHLPFVPDRSTAVLISGTVFLDLGVMDGILELFRGRSILPVVLLVDNYSFPAIHGWPPPRDQILERRREVAFFLQSRGVPVRILDATDDLETALGRADLAS